MTYSLVTAKLEMASTDVARSVCGPIDAHLRAVESRFGVKVSLHGLTLIVEGEDAEEALAVLARMEEDARVGRKINPSAAPLGNARGSVTPRTEGQKELYNALRSKTLVIARGPAGTGKTQLAVDAAVESLKAGRVQRIILTRPAVEAGERLGFLPGDMKEKVDPYMRPLYDALSRHYDAKSMGILMNDKIIEIAPVAFLRGRTLGNAGIVVDEAQNLTCGQTKMVLTRIGENSTMAFVGDVEQIDLPTGCPSGLNDAYDRLNNVKGVGLVTLTRADCVRSALVGKILDAYAKP